MHRGRGGRVRRGLPRCVSRQRCRCRHRLQRSRYGRAGAGNRSCRQVWRSGGRIYRSAPLSLGGIFHSGLFPTDGPRQWSLANRRRRTWRCLWQSTWRRLCCGEASRALRHHRGGWNGWCILIFYTTLNRQRPGSRAHRSAPRSAPAPITVELNTSATVPSDTLPASTCASPP